MAACCGHLPNIFGRGFDGRNGSTFCVRGAYPCTQRKCPWWSSMESYPASFENQKNRF